MELQIPDSAPYGHHTQIIRSLLSGKKGFENAWKGNLEGFRSAVMQRVIGMIFLVDMPMLKFVEVQSLEEKPMVRN